MSAAKHTPGPWEHIPQNGAGPMIAHSFETGNQMRPTGLRLIAHMLERKSSLEEDQANACLIAAAPDLLGALKRTLKFIRLGNHPNVGDMLDQAEAAIAKAEAAP